MERNALRPEVRVVVFMLIIRFRLSFCLPKLAGKLLTNLLSVGLCFLSWNLNFNISMLRIEWGMFCDDFVKRFEPSENSLRLKPVGQDSRSMRFAKSG
jgi:hypothetical protein